MSTITSPRRPPSITSSSLAATPTSSRRPSADSSRSPSRSQPQPQPPTGTDAPAPRRQQRGNRAALRDYYGIKAGANTNANAEDPRSPRPGDGEGEGEGEGEQSELDRPGFVAEEYLERVLAREGLEGVLRVEGRLVGEIRGLDGERKALVYDNYSKLITATDTIRKMRANMDPLTPTTSTLQPALSHIAETAATLAATLHDRTPPSPFSPAFPRRTAPPPAFRGNAEEERRKKAEEVRTVKWVLDAPRRVRGLVEAGRREEAEREWRVVEGVLGRWEGVGGVEEVRREGVEALGRGG